MAKFCTNCGKELSEGVMFCPECGTQVASEHINVTSTQPLGFSERAHDPEILAAVKKTRGMAKIFTLILVPLPLIGFFIYSLVSREMETGDALKYGAIVSLIFLIFALYSLVKNRESNEYEAVVIDKKHRTKTYNDSNREFVDEYITVVRTTDGKKKKIREHGGRIWAYNYLQIGDRFRYHPQFAFPYELYDKSKTDIIYCVGCQFANPVTADRCSHCHLPLLKK